MNNLDKFIKSLKTNMSVDVGVLKNIQYPDKNVTVAYIGSVHEFGTDKAGRGKKTKIPARSFLKMPLEEKRKEIENDVLKNAKDKLKAGDIEGIFSLIGTACIKQIQNAFETKGFGKWADNEQSTIDAKGSSMPLIDTGLLRKTISYKVNKGK